MGNDWGKIGGTKAKSRVKTKAKEERVRVYDGEAISPEGNTNDGNTEGVTNATGMVI